MTKGLLTPKYIDTAICKRLRAGHQPTTIVRDLASLGIQTSRAHVHVVRNRTALQRQVSKRTGKKCLGRPTIISPRFDRRILWAAGKAPRKTAADIQTELSLPGCLRTVQRHMVQPELKTTYEYKFVRQTKGGPTLRVKWCRKVLGLIAQGKIINDVIATDEKYFTCDGPEAPRQVHWNTRFPRPTTKRRIGAGGGLSVLIGLGPLGFTDALCKKGRMNGEDYGRFFDCDVVAQNCKYSLDDNYKPHRVQDVRHIASDSGVEALEPPASCPDINFAEKALAVLTGELYKKGKCYKDPDHLEQEIANTIDRLQRTGQGKELYKSIMGKWPDVLKGIVKQGGAPNPKWRNTYSATK
jgi:hypothetical protein